MPTDLSTLLAELDEHWNAVGPLHLEATDDGVDIADVGLRCLAEVPDRLGVTSQERDGIVRLVNAYPQLREGIARLQAWKAEALAVEAQWDVQAVGRAIGAPLGANIRPRILPEIARLRALVAQQREEIAGYIRRTVGHHYTDCICVACEGVAPLRAVLAQEVPGE